MKFSTHKMSKMSYPYTFEDITDEEKKVVEDILTLTDFVHVVPSDSRCLAQMKKYGPEIYNFEAHKEDFWLVGFPRTGTTLLQEIIYLIGTDLDYESAAAKTMDERFPFLEHVFFRSEQDEELYERSRNNSFIEEEEGLDPPHVKLAMLKGKRFIKSHLGFHFLPPNLLDVGCKVSFIARNPKDTLVSNYYYPGLIKHDHADTEGLYKLWLLWSKKISYLGSYFEILKESWKRRNNENLLFLFYEDVNADKRSYLKKITDFLGKKSTDEQLQKLLEHIDIENFRTNKSLNNEHMVKAGHFVESDTFSFIRKGKNGGWREKFSPEFNKMLDEWIEEELKNIPNFEMPECWEKAMDLKLD